MRDKEGKKIARGTIKGEQVEAVCESEAGDANSGL